MTSRLLSTLAGVAFPTLFLASCTVVGMPPSAPPAPSTVDGTAGEGAGAGGGESTPTGIAGHPEGGAEGPVPGAGDAREVRALWVVRTTLANPDSVRAMVRRADEAGINTLLVQVRGRGDAYYRSRWEPRAEVLADAPAGYDPLELVLREARARDLAVHAWVNTHLVGGIGALPESPDHLIHARPEWLAVPRPLARTLHGTDPRDPAYVHALLEYARANDGQVEGIFTSPSHRGVRDHLLAVWADLLERYDLDGLHLDYVRYPTADFDYSPAALEDFRGWVRPRIAPELARDLDRADDPLAYPRALPDRWSEFRTARVTELVRETAELVRRTRPDVVVSAAVRADVHDALAYRFQDWEAWLDAGIVDAVAPMAYTSDRERFGGWVRDAVARGGGERVWAGIGMYMNSFGGTLRQIERARAEGAGGIALFSYDWAVAQAEVESLGLPYLQGVGVGAFATTGAPSGAGAGAAVGSDGAAGARAGY